MLKYSITEQEEKISRMYVGIFGGMGAGIITVGIQINI
jgi:hypothetical protein